MQLSEADAQRLFPQLLVALDFRRTMGAAHDLLVDDVMLATAAPSSRGSGGLPTVKMCVCTQRPNMGFVPDP